MLSHLFSQTRPSLSAKRGWIGIDIGRQAIKVAQIERRDHQWKVVFGRITEIRPGEHPVHQLPAAVRPSLNRGHSWFGEPVACVLSSSLTHSQCVDLPASSAETQIAALGSQLEVDFRLSETSFAHWPSTWAEDGPSRPHHVVCLDHRHGIEVAERLLTLGLRAETLDILPFCLARCLQLSHPDATSTIAAIDWSVAEPTFSIIRGGRPYFTRTLKDCGFGQVINSLAQGLALSTEEASQLLTRTQQVPPTGERLNSFWATVHELLAADVTRFADEVARTITYLRSEGTDLAPEQLVLFGAGSLLDGIAGQLSRRLEIPTTSWRLNESEHRLPTSHLPPTSLLGPALALSAIPLLP